MIKQKIICDFCGEKMPKQIWVITHKKIKYDMCENCNKNYREKLYPLKLQKENGEITQNKFGRLRNMIMEEMLQKKEGN